MVSAIRACRMSITSPRKFEFTDNIRNSNFGTEHLIYLKPPEALFRLSGSRTKDRAAGLKPRRASCMTHHLRCRHEQGVP